jgi:hypothetical protein
MTSRVLRIIQEAELDSRMDLLMLIEQTCTNNMSRYQRLAALVEISSTVSRMTGKAPDDIYSRLVGVPQSKLSNAINSLLREAKQVAA